MSALRPLSLAEKLDWLHLLRCDNIGPRSFQYLLTRFGSAQAALKALPEMIRSGKMGTVRITPREDAERELAEALGFGVEIIGLHEPAYPPALREIDSAPPLLFVRGRLDALQKPMVSLVGSRNASAAGLLFTERLARGLGEAGYVVSSGLARGIDARAHRAALPTGTIAVLAGGQNRIYPSEHARFADEITETGAIISEMPHNWEPRGRDFPRRNRLVAGIALCTVVIEAALKSGSLITARLANEQGRQVFAVPGSPLDPRAEGTNNLLREGASLCASLADVVDALEPMRNKGLPPRDLFRAVGRSFSEFGEDWNGSITGQEMPENEPRDHIVASPTTSGDTKSGDIVALLGPSPVAIDEIIRCSGMGTTEVQMTLLELELTGRLQRHGNGMVSLI